MYDLSLVLPESPSLRTHHQSAQGKEDEHHAANLKKQVFYSFKIDCACVLWFLCHIISMKRDSQSRSLIIRPASKMDRTLVHTPLISQHKKFRQLYSQKSHPTWLTRLHWVRCKMYMAYHKDHYQGIDLTNVTVRTDILVAIIRPPTTANPVQRACPRTPGIRIGLLTLISLEYS